ARPPWRSWGPSERSARLERLGHRGADLLHRGREALTRGGGHLDVRHAARDRPVPRGEVAVHIEREPVAGDPPALPHADRGYLAAGGLGPHTGEQLRPGRGVPALGGQPERGERVDQPQLDLPHVVDDALVLTELDDQVADELAGAVVGELPAAAR